MSDEPIAGEVRALALTAEQLAAAAKVPPGGPPADDTPPGGPPPPSASGPASEGAEAPSGDAEPASEGAGQPAPWSDPRLPWEGRPRRVDIACWAAITGSGLYYLILLPFRASLVGTHPVTGVLLNGATESIVSAAAFARVGHGSLWVVLLAVIPGLMKFDLIYWWAGRLWGARIINLFAGNRERTRRRVEKFVARVDRWGRWFTWPAMVLAPFLPFPSAIIYAVAGWTGMSWVTFLALDAIGSLAWGGLLAGLGYALGQHAVSVAQTVSKYGLWVSIAVVVLVIASQMRGARAQR
ncbi:MAG TPA: DedA family protein [Trebonia sp.]|nr:DedA family protein [Trebonia sp.]